MSETQTHAEERAPLAVAVGVTVNRLQNDYLSGGGRAPAARGVLAELRRGAGRPALSDPLALERVLGVMDPVLTENEVGTQDGPSPSEEAAEGAIRGVGGSGSVIQAASGEVSSAMPGAASHATPAGAESSRNLPLGWSPVSKDCAAWRRRILSCSSRMSRGAPRRRPCRAVP